MVEKDELTGIVADGDIGDSTWGKCVSSRFIPGHRGNLTSIPILTNPTFFQAVRTCSRSPTEAR